MPARVVILLTVLVLCTYRISAQDYFGYHSRALYIEYSEELLKDGFTTTLRDTSASLDSVLRFTIAIDSSEGIEMEFFFDTLTKCCNRVVMHLPCNKCAKRCINAAVNDKHYRWTTPIHSEIDHTDFYINQKKFRTKKRDHQKYVCVKEMLIHTDDTSRVCTTIDMFLQWMPKSTWLEHHHDFR